MELEEIMNKKVREVSSRFFSPSIPKPELTEDVPNGSADIASGQIKISPSFIDRLEKNGIPSHESLDEVLSHEFTHITRFPGTAQRRMHQYAEARTTLESKELAEAAVYAFNEAQTNLYVGIDMKNQATPKVAGVLAKGSRGLNKLLDGLYQEMLGQDLGVKLSRKEKQLIKKLKEFPFTDQGSEDTNLKRFIELTKSDVSDYKPRQSSGFLGMFTEDKIQEGLTQIAQECSNKGYSPNQFEQLASELLSDGKIVPGAGTAKGKLWEARDIYTALSRNYAVPIVRKNMFKNGSLRPEEHKPFSTETPLEDLDPFSSKGILPGITQAWVRKEGETAAQKGIPNSIIVIDNSPSMPDPNKVVSMPVLGGNVIARAYLLNDKTVTVYSFGSSDYVYGPSKDEKEIGRVLRLHSGEIGGTTFSSERLETLLKDRKEVFDLSIISDMEISNLGDFIKTVSSIPRLNRIHLFYTNAGRSGCVRQVQEATKAMENVGYAQLCSKEDIERITLGELKKSLR